MTNPVALILDGSSRAALETAIALGRQGIVVDIATDRQALAAKSRYVRSVLTCPNPCAPDSYNAWLADIDAVNNYRLIVPATEASLKCLMRVNAEMPLRHKAILPADAALQTALSKEATWQFAKALGIRIPPSVLIEPGGPLPPVGKLPSVLKPVSSLAVADGKVRSLKPEIVTNAQERHTALVRLLTFGAVQEQAYVGGRGFGVECLYHRGQQVWNFQHERLHELPLTGGGSTYRRSVARNAELTAAATKLLDALQWHGVAMVEFKGTPETGFYLMEINPRLWGSLALAIDAGVNFPLGLWQLANGEVPLGEVSYKVPFYTRNLEADIEWMKGNLRADHSNPLLLTRPRLQSCLEYGRVLLGSERWDHFDWKDWRVAIALLRSSLNAGLGGVKARIGQFAWQQIARYRHRRLVKALVQPATAVRRILFLCYGNICRSALAESVGHSCLPGVEIESAGFHPVGQRPTPKAFQDVVKEFQIDLSRSASKRVTSAMVQKADLILVADLANYRQFASEFPDAVHKMTLLGLFAADPQTILIDPYNLDTDSARLAAARVIEAVKGVAAWLQASAVLAR